MNTINNNHEEKTFCCIGATGDHADRGVRRGYLNGYSTQTDCCFILGLNGQNGQDVKNGALWDINYVDGKGFTLKNVYTGKYLKDALSAKYDEPTYFTFCTLGYKTTGISIVNSDERDVQEGVSRDKQPDDIPVNVIHLYLDENELTPDNREDLRRHCRNYALDIVAR